MAELNSGLYAFGVVKDVQENISKKTGEVWSRTVSMRAGAGKLLEFEMGKDANPPKEGDTVRINYWDSIDTYKGISRLRRHVFKDGIQTMKAVTEPAETKKVSNLKV